MKLKRYRVKLGAQQKGPADAVNEGGQQIFEVERVISHPDYKKIANVTGNNNANNDIALMKLIGTVKLSETVRPSLPISW